MKGRTVCPQCKHSFIVNVPEKSEKYKITCKNCKNVFTINCTPNGACTYEGQWEEHGEPRKTVLSAIKPQTNKPFIASFLLLAVGVLGFLNVFFELNNQTFIPFITWIFDYITHVEFALLIVIGAIFAIIGSLTTIKRRYFQLSIACSIIGIFSIGFFVGSILAIAALILLILARDEFEHGTKGKIF
jgi:hypothetical protein